MLLSRELVQTPFVLAKMAPRQGALLTSPTRTTCTIRTTRPELPQLDRRGLPASSGTRGATILLLLSPPPPLSTVTRGEPSGLWHGCPRRHGRSVNHGKI